MNQEEFVKALLTYPKVERRKALYDYLQGLGFKPKTYNYNHICVRNDSFWVDLWAGTAKNGY